MAKNLDLNNVGPRTCAIHAGEIPDPVTGASSPNIVMSTTFVTDGPEGFSAYELDEDSPFVYTRLGNPTVRQLEQKLAALEGSEAALCFASGMAAAAAIFMTLLSNGDHVIVSDVSYAGIAELVRDTLPRMGVEVSLVNTAKIEEVQAAVQDNTRLIFIDTPCNPLLRLTDIAAVATIAKAAGALVAVDNTFATPLGTKPLALGADIVMHSASKFLCGHGDAIGGAVCASAEIVQKLAIEATVHYGGILSPFNAWLIARGIATLPLRLKAHEETALEVAAFLENHPKVERVNYPGLASHPQHELAKRQMSSFSSMLSFQVKGGEAEGKAMAFRMAEKLSIIHYAVSLGHHRSLICWMPTESLLQTSFRVDASSEADYRVFAGDGLFRFSIGLEDAQDLCRDLDSVM